MADTNIPFDSIRSAPDEDPAARAIGEDVAGVLRYQIEVLDREDRLESRTGEWKQSFRGDAQAQRAAATESVLRSIQIASNPDCYRIIDALGRSENLRTDELVTLLGLGRVTLNERVGDLVSAGLVTKIPEADQVRITAGGSALAELINRAAGIAARELARKE